MVKYGKIYSTMVKIYMMIMFLLQLDILTRLDPIGVKLFLHFFFFGEYSFESLLLALVWSKLVMQPGGDSRMVACLIYQQP